MTRRQHDWTDNDRATALALLIANGGNVARTARDYGCSQSTLRLWRAGNPGPPAEAVTERAEGLREAYDRLALRTTGIIALGLNWIESDETGQRAAAQLGDLNRVAGTATDKAQLLSGEPTSRTEHTVDLDLSSAD